jgi:hypothetical protein
MHASPLRKQRKPRYPTRLEIEADPALLRRQMPAEWSRYPELVSAAAILLASTLPGCQSAPSAGSKATPKAEPSNGVAIVAPLFAHGDGVGAFGCLVVAPPVYLTEEEAWRVIDNELAKRGLKLTEKEHLIPGIEIPLYSNAELEVLKEGDPLPKPSSIEPLKADRADPQRKIVLEFVSSDNPPEKMMSCSMGTIGSIQLKEEADALRELVAEKSIEKIYFGALYDPAVSPPDYYSDIRRPNRNSTPTERKAYSDSLDDSAKAKAKRLLRLQVRDFIHWLQGQGAI